MGGRGRERQRQRERGKGGEWGGRGGKNIF